jgi:hypothetical protein
MMSCDGTYCVRLGVGQAAFQAAIEEAEPVGVITIEDVIEELIGGEILDETDRFVDNLKRERVTSQPSFSEPFYMREDWHENSCKRTVHSYLS